MYFAAAKPNNGARPAFRTCIKRGERHAKIGNDEINSAQAAKTAQDVAGFFQGAGDRAETRRGCVLIFHIPNQMRHPAQGSMKAADVFTALRVRCAMC